GKISEHEAATGETSIEDPPRFAAQAHAEQMVDLGNDRAGEEKPAGFGREESCRGGVPAVVTVVVGVDDAGIEEKRQSSLSEAGLFENLLDSIGGVTAPTREGPGTGWCFGPVANE